MFQNDLPFESNKIVAFRVFIYLKSPLFDTPDGLISLNRQVSNWNELYL